MDLGSLYLTEQHVGRERRFGTVYHELGWREGGREEGGREGGREGRREGRRWEGGRKGGRE